MCEFPGWVLRSEPSAVAVARAHHFALCVAWRPCIKKADLGLMVVLVGVLTGAAYGLGRAEAWEKVAMVLFAPVGATCRYRLSIAYNKKGK